MWSVKAEHLGIFLTLPLSLQNSKHLLSKTELKGHSE